MKKMTNIKKLSSFVDGRLIWGSDETIEKFKKFKTKLKCSDLFFVDKFSISVFQSNSLIKFQKIK